MNDREFDPAAAMAAQPQKRPHSKPQVRMAHPVSFILLAGPFESSLAEPMTHDHALRTWFPKFK